MITEIKLPKIVSENLPTNPFAFEVFALASKQRSNAKKVEILQKYEHPSIKSLLIWNFDDTVISLLPEGLVPYASVGQQNVVSGNLSDNIARSVEMMEELSSNSIGSQDQGRTSIRKEYTYFYNFVKGGNDRLSSRKRETMFINILEGLHPLEAEILMLVKDKNLETKYKISKQNVSDAFPDIQWGDRS
jgi:hypothetical protein